MGGRDIKFDKERVVDQGAWSLRVDFSWRFSSLEKREQRRGHFPPFAEQLLSIKNGRQQGRRYAHYGTIFRKLIQLSLSLCLLDVNREQDGASIWLYASEYANNFPSQLIPALSFSRFNDVYLLYTHLRLSCVVINENERRILRRRRFRLFFFPPSV